MFSPEAIENFACRFAFARLQFIEAALDAADGVQHVLERGGVLHNQFRPAIDGQNRRAAGGFEPLEMRLGVALKIRQRADILQGDHNMKFTALTMPCNFAVIGLESKR